MELNNIIRRHQGKEKLLLDELINQIEEETNKPIDNSPPIEVTEQVKTKMIQLMDAYLSNKDKLVKVNAIRKELTAQSTVHLKELETLMRLYGYTELIKGNNKFVLDRTTRKKPLKKTEFKEVMTCILGDVDKVDKIYQTVNQMSEDIVIEKIKCLKYKEK